MRSQLSLTCSLTILAWFCFLVLGLVRCQNAAASNVELKVLDPRAELFTNPSVPINPRLKSLEGKKIGILNNSKPGADDFAPALMQVLKETYPGIQFKMWVIPYNEYPNKANDLKALAEWSDAVVGMMGD
jgi:hypothetical protein